MANRSFSVTQQIQGEGWHAVIERSSVETLSTTDSVPDRLQIR